MTSSSNPFPAIEAALLSEVYLSHTPSYHPQLYALSGVYGLGLVLTLAAFVLKCRGGFWLYRLHPTTYGSWITPNAILCWLLYSGIFQSRKSRSSGQQQKGVASLPDAQVRSRGWAELIS